MAPLNHRARIIYTGYDDDGYICIYLFHYLCICVFIMVKCVVKCEVWLFCVHLSVRCRGGYGVTMGCQLNC